MAFVSATTQMAVISGITPGVSTTKPANGSLSWYIVTPAKYRMLAARTCPAILAGADIERKSSTRPRTKMAAAAIRTPIASLEPVKTGLSAGITEPAIMAMATPMNIAPPPP